jgi:hypothetical protein
LFLGVARDGVGGLSVGRFFGGLGDVGLGGCVHFVCFQGSIFFLVGIVGVCSEDRGCLIEHLVRCILGDIYG